MMHLIKFRILILWLFTFSIYISCNEWKSKPAKEGELLEYYTTGELQKKYKLSYGKKDGECLFYDKDGKVKGIIRYRNDLQEGKTEYFYPSGKHREIQYYSEGKKTGWDSVFYENGQLFQLIHFMNGQLHGDQYHYDTTGKMIHHGIFNADTLVKVIDLR
ncbi:MAG: hypothetical protein IPM48_08270 [Saprospiraceae bacterium]|nr:hypothetical protein [Saprospiraceae bacterium]